MRSGLLNQSTLTRSFSSACLTTHDVSGDRSTRTVRFETPPPRTVQTGSSLGPISACACNQSLNTPGCSMSSSVAKDRSGFEDDATVDNGEQDRQLKQIVWIGLDRIGSKRSQVAAVANLKHAAERLLRDDAGSLSCVAG